MFTFLFYIIVFVFVIGILVLVHEWGHYIAARKIGVTVEEFAVGMGPKIFGWEKDGTIYKLCALPIGGYCKMAGENVDDERSGNEGEFLSRKRWERFVILIMGPLLNIIFAFAVWYGMFMIGEEKPAWLFEPPVAGYVTPGGPAAKVGIDSDDQVMAINGKEMATWEDFLYAVATSPREKIELTMLQHGEVNTYSVQPFEDKTTGIGSVGITPNYPPVIHGLAEGQPAMKAGFQEGDVVTIIDGEPVDSYYDILFAIRGRPGEVAENNSSVTSRSFEFTLMRGAELITLTLSPEVDENLGFPRIGISPPPMPMRKVSLGPIAAFGKTFDRVIDMSGRMFSVLGKMFTGKLSTKALSGPVDIAVISGQAAEQGILPLLNLLAFISLNLGIANLLPIPVLDGGHITILTIESLLRRDLNEKVKEWIMKVGIILLISLMSFIIVQDIIKRFA